MKFTCESCSAQYMISDDKVGPNGVRVRCKKCGNVIVVRRVAEAPAAAPAQPAASSGSPPAGAEKGIDAELGKAFDQAFGDTPPSTAAPGAEKDPGKDPGAEKDLGATQAMGAEDAARIFAASAPAQADWYVAIGQAQVGPLPLAEVKRKWEAGDLGPDSLVWRPGMGDWSPLTTVPDLAGYLAPIPRAASQRAAERGPSARKDPRSEPAPATAPAAEVSWKPVGASALAALANEEMAGRAAPAQRPSPRPSQGGVKSLVDALPDGGGVDPTGALPLSIRALEQTDEKKIEPRTSIARGAEKARHKRSASRAVAFWLVAGILLVGGGAVGAVVLYQRMMAAPKPAQVAAAAPPTVTAPVPAPPTPEPVAAASAPADPPPAVEPPPAAEPDKAATKAPTKATRAAAPPPREARKAEPRKPPEKRVAAAPAERKKGDSLLDFESNDAALDAALGGGSAPSGRSVYVPPAAGGLPDKVSPGDINGAVAQRIDALRRCVTEQKSREPDASGTLKMRWTILPDGGVRDVKSLTPEYAQGAFAACISGVVKSIRFPRSTTTGQEVVFPFNF